MILHWPSLQNLLWMCNICMQCNTCLGKQNPWTLIKNFCCQIPHNIIKNVYCGIFHSIDYIRCARVTCVAHAEDGSRLVWGRWKGEAHWTPRLYEESMHTVDGLATGSWGPESGGCVPLGRYWARISNYTQRKTMGCNYSFHVISLTYRP